ncbi:MAG TPA: ABC transporter permease, partial [Candidatus Eisenbacteria bacterium]|nr:ABC transporter permease [Candidatus Eisenbacteria bacterium]
APGKVFLLGTDQFGRDVFSRLLFGARVSLSVGLVGIVITYVLGLFLGGLAGYYRGWVDTTLMRVSEVFMSIPALYLILALRALFPDDLPSGLLYVAVVTILSLVLWASLARIIRGMVLSIRELDYVRAAEALGVGPLRVILRHVLPNTASFVIVAATLSVPGYILGEVALSFLGAGVQEPTPSWGNMLREAQNVPVLASFPWILAPGVVIFLTVLAFNFLGDGLRDALDPRTAGNRT